VAIPRGHVVLERALSKLGAATRTEARRLIEAGRVTVDGVVVRDPQWPVVPERAKITIDSETIQTVTRIVVALHKPRGTVTTRRDPQGRPTVYDCLQGLDAHVVPVGRLDFATSGLLLLTNDTRLADRLTDPRTGVVRTYVATVQGRVEPDDLLKLEQGVEDEGEALQAMRASIRKASGKESVLILDLTEGRNREVRRLCAAIGHPVTRLKRIAYGPVQLGELPAGQWRMVPEAELGPIAMPERKRDGHR
jgi:23S rRNA pseudouridine2605 synthase